MSDAATGPQATTDPGLFGPDSVTWRIHGDPVMLLAGIRALLLQTVHPLAMAGVAQHSGFRSDPWGRLLRTAEYVGVTTYGTRDAARRMGARVRSTHRGLAGIEPESGQAYQVEDPALLLWVHCCEVDSFLSTYRRCGGPLSDDEADAYVAEQVREAALVGLKASLVPASQADLAGYFAGVRPELRVTAEARRTTRFVLLPSMPAWVAWATPARPAWAGLAGLAFAMLPRWTRRMYLLPAAPTTDLAASLAGTALRRSLLMLPEGVRTGPHEAAARRRLDLG